MLYEGRSRNNQAKPKEGQNQCPGGKWMKYVYLEQVCNMAIYLFSLGWGKRKKHKENINELNHPGRHPG